MRGIRTKTGKKIEKKKKAKYNVDSCIYIFEKILSCATSSKAEERKKKEANN